MEYGIYVHIPFCLRKCYYCDFPSYAGRERYFEQYTEALLWELRQRTAGLPAAETIYIGGGTPTVLPPFLLEKILKGLADFVKTDNGTEFTLEANPATVSPELLITAKTGGVNRISLGVQTFSDVRLKAIGRSHSAAEAYEAVKMIREAGFSNLNIDLIYALPDETLSDLQNDVQATILLEPQHISIYGLQLEEGTVFSVWQKKGTLNLPSEKTAEEMYDYLTAELPRHGYERYEISNFSQPGFASRHNLGYWQDKPYLGIGAAAHSYWGDRRLENPVDIEEYINIVKRRQLPFKETEPATRENRLAEFCFLALRTAEGIDKEKFVIKFGCDIGNIYGKQIEKLKTQELLYETDKRIALTELGMKYGNVAFAEFIL